MTTQTRGRRPLRSTEVWLRQAADENVVVDRATGAVHVLNSTAFALWVLCDGDTEPDEVIDAVCHLTGLPREVVEEDVLRTFADLEQAQLIRWT
jgi:hypothetical protein